MSDIDGIISGDRLDGTVSGGARMTGTMSSGISRIGNTRNYEALDNLPSIEEVVLIGNRSLTDFGMGFADAYDIHQLFRG